MLKRFTVCVLCILLFAATPGCSFFVPYTQTITVNGQPADATVVVNGQTVTVPAVLTVSRKKNVNIIVSKKGYYPYMSSTGYTVSSWGMLDIFGGAVFLVPIIGLVSPGAFELEQTNFYYILTPVDNR